MSRPERGRRPSRGAEDREKKARDHVVVLLEQRGRFTTGTPFFEPGRQITIEARGRVRTGRLALVRLVGSNHGQHVETLGSPDVARDVLAALLADRGHHGTFDDRVDGEAAEAARSAPDRDPVRTDLRDLTTFTIDPTTAKDFDDAISAQDLGGGVRRVWVHIADVSAHVRPDTALDREAYRRATSVYVPGRVAPMLPEILSNQGCSLVPREDRLAVTVEMDVRGPKVERAAFYRSLIRSDERLDYDRVDHIFAGDKAAAEPWATPLRVAREVAVELDSERASKGALVIASSEPEFGFDDEGHVIDVRPSEQTESHRVIEHLMIAANEAVARHLSESGTPALYRVHESPEPTAVRRLVDQLASLDVATPPVGEHLTPQQAGDLVGEISRLVDQHVKRVGRGRAALTSLVLRSLQQAHYSHQNLGHTGLHSTAYGHFTSPIRRYPDLVCHRALLSVVGGAEEAPPAQQLPETGVWTSARERDAMKAERQADDIARCFLLERELFHAGQDQVFDGEIVGMAPIGAFVAFGREGTGHEGLLPVRRLRGEWWELNEEGTILQGRESGAQIRLGDPVRVEVGRIDTARGRVDLYPVEVPASSGRD